MSTISNGPSGHLERFRRAVGVASGASWTGTLLSCLFPDTVLSFIRNWPIHRSRLFPHVKWDALGLSDLLRIPLQLIWLSLFRRPEYPVAGASSVPVAGASEAGGHAASSSRSGTGAYKDTGLYQGVRRRLGHGIAKLENILRTQFRAYASHKVWDNALLRYGAYTLATLLAIMCITTPFNTMSQLVFVSVLMLIALVVRRIPGRVPTLLLVVLSLTASTRYLWWRMVYTLNWDASLDLTWGVVLLCAEIYTWLILVLGYMQTTWPLERKPHPMPEDPQSWPVVDVYIPTYNEPLKVVIPTVLAALGMDWPRNKLHIYLLDDGRRDEFRAFAAEVGVGYIIRPDNKHAKAGNLNHALSKTDGEFIAIFDCDHVPTRSFLQTTMGAFIHESRLALVQTPHHFYSPDAFERNLGLFRRTPNEGELFYGVIQDCNDLWNATFFCGSCAVIKREPLERIGGVAVETVTEDAHTALKLHRLGYTTAYINLAQAAGLATESLSAHIGQRIRWARGMAQIFRIDNPFFGKGLSWAQRICYSNAMLHFLNGAPRLIFLTAPLAFLLFHAYIIYTPAIYVLLYVLPHMVHANITNSRIQGKHRHSFWAEVYETVLAWYIFRPTTMALIAPHKGNFNVTAKGGLVKKNYFDWTISLPYMVIVGLNVLGFSVGIWRMVFGPVDEIPTTLLNMVWTIYNLLLLGAAVSVAAETRQLRRSHRVKAKLSSALRLPGGGLVRCETVDFSESGAALAYEGPEKLQGQHIDVSLWRGDEEFSFPAVVVGQSPHVLRISWELTSRAQQADLVQCTFARADAWVSWADGRMRDMPLLGLRKVLLTGVEGYRRVTSFAMPATAKSMIRIIGPEGWLASLLPRLPLPVRTT